MPVMKKSDDGFVNLHENLHFIFFPGTTLVVGIHSVFRDQRSKSSGRALEKTLWRYFEIPYIGAVAKP